MKREMIARLHEQFEESAREVEGAECWFARELQGLLGYSKWENFAKVVDKARTSCLNAGQRVVDHFPDVRNMVDLESGSQREIDDVALTRYACYLIAQNGDPKIGVSTRNCTPYEQAMRWASAHESKI